jgi:hypothetical protein
MMPDEERRGQMKSVEVILFVGGGWEWNPNIFVNFESMQNNDNPFCNAQDERLIERLDKGLDWSFGVWMGGWFRGW